jgi:DUF1009 family protein
LSLDGLTAKNGRVTTLGIIAGNGDLPLLLARSARAQGHRVVIAACEGETNPAVAEVADECEWVRLGELGRLIRVFTSRQIGQAVIAGSIAPGNAFQNLRLDLRMIAMAARLKVRNPASVLRAMADELGRDGIELLDPRSFLRDQIPSVGILSRRQPNHGQREDIEFGLGVARAVSAQDVGKTVVVKQGLVLAVEAFEGSAECLRRGGLLAGERGGAVAVKVTQSNHDFRFDIPCIDLRTIEACVAGKVAVLAVEAGHTVLLDKSAAIEAVDANGLVLVAV